MRTIYQRTYKRDGQNIQEIAFRDITRTQAREVRKGFYNTYSKVEMHPFEIYEDRPRNNSIPTKTYKGYIFYIWLDSRIEEIQGVD